MNTYLEGLELLPYLHGCYGTFEQNGKIGYSRFTKEQLDFYASLEDTGYGDAAFTSVGIYLECETEASEISFDYTLGPVALAGSSIDIWENGEYTKHVPLVIPSSDAPAGESALTHVSYQKQDPGTSLIRIYFPNAAVFFPCHFDLKDAKPTAKKGTSILFYGDSITQSGYIHYPSLSWYCSVADGLNAEYINRGVGSFVFTSDSLPSQTDCNPDLIFVEYGCNDLFRIKDPQTRLSVMKDYFDKLEKLYPDAKIYCITPDFVTSQHLERNSGAYTIEELNVYCEDLAAECTKRNIPVLYGRKLVPPLDELRWSDGIHLNEAGSAIFAHNLLRSL